MGRIAKLKVIWERLNAEHFGGELQAVPIRITRSRRCYGYFNAPNNGGRPSIRISTVLADTEELLRDTMAHEMIHQFLHSRFETGAQDWAGHGSDFQHHNLRIFGCEYVEST